ncbi:Hypothetical protein NTJ_06710 [Nesidiocoris tenuis]|uniref:G-protein coupled receptors family 1 profile domain-containing protein n=1 Tax=Nesidiocoris tenuis TaxID=355587 RepID=A0ABN7ASJ3_9HEMI|nr:Hypothetical protein NTJ_06710 [Nesidiocoris tenuis]
MQTSANSQWIFRSVLQLRRPFRPRGIPSLGFLVTTANYLALIIGRATCTSGPHGRRYGRIRFLLLSDCIATICVGRE